MITPILENPGGEPRQMEELVENLQVLVGTAERKVRQTPTGLLKLQKVNIGSIWRTNASMH